MSVGGKKRENLNFEEKKKYVGLFTGKVITINPTIKEYKEILGIDLKEESRATEYLGESKEGNITLRIQFWLQEAKTKENFPVTFFLENKQKENKDQTKKQYINKIGNCSWAYDPNNLPKWFVAKGEDSYRVAFVGEEELYNFSRVWIGGIDYRDSFSELSFDWKLLMKGNVEELKNLINGEFTTSLLAMAEIKSVYKDGDVKEYQSVYNRAFMPEYLLKNFRLVDYNKLEEQSKLKIKTSSDLKPHEKFVLQISGEYGSKNYFYFKDIKEYDPSENLASSNEPISTDGADY